MGKIRRDNGSREPLMGFAISDSAFDWDDEERTAWRRWLTNQRTKHHNEPPCCISELDRYGNPILVWPRKQYRKRHRRMAGK